MAQPAEMPPAITANSGFSLLDALTGRPIDETVRHYPDIARRDFSAVLVVAAVKWILPAL